MRERVRNDASKEDEKRNAKRLEKERKEEWRDAPQEPVQHPYLNSGDWVGVRRAALHHPIHQVRLCGQVLRTLDMSKQQVLKIIPHDIVRGKANVAPVLGAEVAGTTRITVDRETERS